MDSYCRGKELKESTTTYAAVLGKYTIIKNVPCLENASNAERNITATRTKELNSEFFVAEYKAA